VLFDAVRDAIVTGETSGTMNMSDTPELKLLVRGGILITRRNFTCMAAEWYYYNKLFPSRARKAPESIEDMIVQCVKSFSSSIIS